MKKHEYFSVEAYSASKIKMYESNPDMLSFSNSDLFSEAEKQKTSRAFVFGNVFHRAVLEREEFLENKEIILNEITPAERKILDYMLRTLSSNSMVHPLIKNAMFIEKPLFGDLAIENNGKQVKVKIKGMIDLYTKNNILVDLKTTNSLDNFYFSNFKKFRYDIQLALYKHLLKLNKYEVEAVILIVAEKSQPYAWQCFLVGDKELSDGEFGGSNKNADYKGFRELITEMHFNPQSRFNAEVVEI